MNLKNIVYASALSTLAATGCSKLPDLRSPEVRVQFEGTYKGIVDGTKVTYKVERDRCILIVDDALFVHIVDKGCDNTADLLNLTMNRKYLLESGKAKDSDYALERTQEELVKPENKVK